MSILIIQIGQCGNQIGHAFFKSIGDKAIHFLDSQNKNNSTFAEDILNRFFNENNTHKRTFTANAILIDTETKVISSLHKSHGKLWNYPTITHSDERPTQGSGNNWAYGYTVHGPQLRQYILDAVRRRMEECASIDGFMIVQSIAGGTGSGLGTYVTELLRETYSNCFIFNQVTWPFLSGEVSVQSYNTVLTLARLYPVSDLILTQSNDDVSDICRLGLSMDNAGFKEMNDVISLNLAAILSPFQLPLNHSTNNMGDILSCVDGNTRNKLYDVVATPYIAEISRSFTNDSWHSILNNVGQLSQHEMCRVYLHGVDLPSRECLQRYSDAPSSPPPSQLFQTRCYGLGDYERRATALVKGSRRLLDDALTKGWQMFARKAFVHQYQCYGLTDGQLLDSFSACEQIVANYDE